MNIVSQIKPVLRGAWRQRGPILIPLLLLVPLTFLVAVLWPAKFETNALVLLQEYEGLGGNTPAYVRAQDLRDKIKSLEALASSEFILRRVMDKSPTQKEPRELSEADLEAYRQRLTVTQVGTQFVKLTLTGNKRDGLGAELSSVLAALFESLLSSNNTSLNASTFLRRARQRDLAELEQRLKNSETSVDDSITSVVNTKRKELQIANLKVGELRPIVDRNLTSLNRKLAEAVPELLLHGAAPVEIAKRLNNELTNLTKDTNSNSLDTPQRRERANTVKALLASATSLAQLTTDLNSNAAAQEQLTKELSRISNVVGQREKWQREANNIRTRYGQLERRDGNLGPAAADIQLLSAPAQIQVIDTPKDPKRPRTSKLKIVLAGLATAFMMSLTFGVVFEQMDGSLRGADMLRSATNLPVVAEFSSLADEVSQSEPAPDPVTIEDS